MLFLKIILSILAFPFLWVGMFINRIFVGVLWGTISKIGETIILPIPFIPKLLNILWLVITLPLVLVLDSISGVFVCAAGAVKFCLDMIIQRSYFD